MSDTNDNSPEPFVEEVGEPIMGTVSEAPVPIAVPAASAAAQRPSDVVIVTLMALLAGLGDVISGIAYLTNGPDGTVKAVAYLAVLIGLITVVVAALLFTGSRVARNIIGILMIVRIGFQIWAWIVIGSAHAAVAMLEILIALVVLILLYSRETNAFLAGTKK